MTDIQIKYWQMLNDRAQLEEAKRHNLVYEGETYRHNVATEDLGYKTLGETNRHNIVTEGIAYDTLAETAKHNRESEAIGWRQADASMLSASAAMRNAATNEYLSTYTAAEKSASAALSLARVEQTNEQTDITRRTKDAVVSKAYYDQATAMWDSQIREAEANYAQDYQKYATRNEKWSPVFQIVNAVSNVAKAVRK